MLSLNPDFRPVAFKEWQLVSDALAQGEQSIILRKGGISEGKAGFQWLHEKFFLFPSLFHEQAEQVIPDSAGGTRKIPEPLAPEGKVAFSVFVETLATGRLTDWDEVAALAPYHIWKEEIIRERFEWGDEPGISWATVRTHVLTDPWILDDRKTFGGCRSWFGLPTDEGGGFRGRLENATTVEPHCGWPPELV
ncbi:MAG: DUF1802 family protein [Verrucomicrobiales bacterium]|nr:DUF1802 family protein [Verrucomicrobiales bacterium]